MGEPDALPAREPIDDLRLQDIDADDEQTASLGSRDLNGRPREARRAFSCKDAPGHARAAERHHSIVMPAIACIDHRRIDLKRAAERMLPTLAEKLVNVRPCIVVERTAP